LTKVFKLRSEYRDLEQRLLVLDQQLANARHLIRHSSSPDAVEQAKQDERALLTQLDRLMTRMRAVEGQHLQLHKKAQQ